MSARLGEAIDRHDRIALQFSGGKDSIAMLWLMRPWWDRLTVYWLNTTDPMPGVVQAVEWAKSIVPNFVEIVSDRREVIMDYGIPSDIIPYTSDISSYALGVGRTVLLQSRFGCCSRTIMVPLHNRMVEDGITLIVRGQKAEDEYKGVLRSGDTADGFEMLFPLEGWTDREVFDYIEHNELPLPSYYDTLPHSGDCLVCPAWLGEGKGKYLKQHHPDRFPEYAALISMVTEACTPHVLHLAEEAELCAGVVASYMRENALQPEVGDYNAK